MSKSSNGQAGVFAARCRGNSAGLVGGHLSFPEAWRKDATRCAQARRPVAQRASRSKPALAQALVEHLLGQGLVRAEWVGGDAASGNSPTRRQALQQRQRAYVLDVGPAGQLHLPEPTPASAPPWAGRPPRPPQPVGSALALSALAAPVPAATWQGLPYRPGQKGPLVRQAVLLPVWRWEQAQAQALELLISRALDGTQLKYSLGYTPPTAPALEVVRALYRQRQRYWPERVLQAAKQQVGLHQSQPRAWLAWQHQVALTRLALHRLLDTQRQQRQVLPNLSFASLKLLLAQKLQNLLHQDDTLLAAVQQRARANAPKHPQPHAP